MRSLMIVNVMLLALLQSYVDASADSARELVNKGNRSYENENYDEALSSYKDALRESPDESKILYNMGAAHYKAGKLDKAEEAFEKSAIGTEDEIIEANNRFNQGNTSFKKAEGLISSDLKGALDNCKRSTNYYQDALQLQPDFREAAENIEIVRLTMKSIQDQMKQQQEQMDKDKQDKDKKTEENESEESNHPNKKESSEENQSGSNEDQGQEKEEKNNQRKTAEESGKKPNDISEMLKEDAEQIIDAEKKNKERRKTVISGEYKAVDRDW